MKPLQALCVLHDTSLSGKAKEKKLQTSMQQLLQNIQSRSCPSYTSVSLLRALSQVNGQVRPGTQISNASNVWDRPETSLPLLSPSWRHCFLCWTGSWSRVAQKPPPCCRPRPS